jgi:hypothetical protein
MQRKLKLDDLQVESFHVLPEAPRVRGTVAGREALAATLDGAYSCYDYTCGLDETCHVSCFGTCVTLCTCDHTCPPQFTCGAGSCVATFCDITCDLSCDGLCSLDVDACPLTA